MTMIDGVEERRIRGDAVKAAGSFLSGTGSDVHSLLFVAEVIEKHIQGGRTAALERYAEGPLSTPPAQQNASPQDTATHEGGSPNPSRAQELAKEGYLATEREGVQEVIRKAEDEKVAQDTVTAGGNSGPLLEYLEYLLNGFPAFSNQTNRNDLGLGL